MFGTTRWARRTWIALAVLLALAGRVQAEPAPPNTLVVFGSGDLVKRKLFPSLAKAWKAGELPRDFRIVVAGRNAVDQKTFLEGLREAVSKIGKVDLGDDAWKAIESRVEYRQADLESEQSVHDLKRFLARTERPARGQKPRERLYYLAVPPSVQDIAIANMNATGLSTDGNPRIILEKPFGRDLASARRTNRSVSKLRPDRVLRIDHYLGKPGIDDLRQLREGDAALDRVWNNQFIERVEISASEQIGIEGRGQFYEETGALRDFLQNHLVQMVAETAREPVAGERARDSRADVAAALRPFTRETVATDVVRKQYAGYRAEPGVDPHSQVETYVAVTTEVQNDRWRGVPFHLESGKALKTKRSAIRIHFRRLTPELAKRYGVRADRPAVLEVQVDPAPGITLKSGRKRVVLSGDDGATRPDPYQRLLVAAMKGDEEYFAGGREVEAAWEWVTPIQEAWAAPDAPPIGRHRQGVARPAGAERLFRSSRMAVRRLVKRVIPRRIAKPRIKPTRTPLARIQPDARKLMRLRKLGVGSALRAAAARPGRATGAPRDRAARALRGRGRGSSTPRPRP